MAMRGGAGEIIARLAALTSEPPTGATALELQAIRAHLARLAADNAEIGRVLGESLGLQRAPDMPQQEKGDPTGEAGRL